MENVVKNQTDIKLTLCDVSNNIDSEIDRIKGVSDILLCVSDNVSEITDNAIMVLHDVIYRCCENLSTLSTTIMEIQKTI